jgi:hypothetical protein
MSNEFKRMMELAGLPITETTTEENTTESLNENFVGIPAINNVFEREKTDYELAFEHFTKGTSILEDYDKASQEMEEESLHQEESEELEESDKPGTAKERSAMAKKARAGKDIGEKGKNFEKIAKSAAKKYGSEEAGKKVAGAVMYGKLNK